MRYKMTLKALSPIHIGTGDQISPLEYVIDVDKERLYRVDLTSFLSEMPPQLQEKFDTAVNSSNYLYMRNFIAESLDIGKYSLFSCPVSEPVAKDYRKKFNDAENQLLIDMFVRSAAQMKPIIPGSSVKGALRTAIVNDANNDIAKFQPPPHSPKDRDYSWESVPLKYGRKEGQRYRFDLKKDPFRAVSVSDMSFCQEPTLIDKVKMIDKTAQLKSSKIVQCYEQTFSALEEENITAAGTLSIHTDLQEKSRGMLGITAESIIKTCNDYYRRRMQQEHEKFYQQNTDLAAVSNQLLSEKYDDSQCLIRLGRFSHCESITLDPPYNNIKTPRRKGRPMPHGTTRTLAGGEFPFGWAKLTLEPIS